MAMGRGNSCGLLCFQKTSPSPTRYRYRRPREEEVVIQRIALMNAKQFVDLLSGVALRNVFNPYRDQCDDHDHASSALIRRWNLQQYLEAAHNCGIESVWLGRDCGYR